MATRRRWTLPSRVPSRSLKRGAGFTLVEVVVAFLLLSMVLATGFELFTAGMRRAIDLEERSKALAVAQSQMAVAGTEVPLKEGTASGQTDDGKYRWTLAIARSEEGAADPPYGVARATYSERHRHAHPGCLHGLDQVEGAGLVQRVPGDQVHGRVGGHRFQYGGEAGAGAAGVDRVGLVGQRGQYVRQ